MNSELQNTLVNILTKAASPSNEIQQEVLRTIDALAPTDDFASALAFLLSRRTDVPAEVRQRAGLLLKTCISRDFPSIHAPEVRELVVDAISDLNPIIRKTAGNVITALVTRSASVPCSRVLHVLLKLFVESTPDIVEGAFDAILKICEDMIELWRQISISFNTEELGVPTENAKILLPDFLEFSNSVLLPAILSHPNARMKVILLNVFATNFLFFPNHALARHLPSYYDVLGRWAASETQPDTVAHICKGLTYIASHHPDLYANSLAAVMNFVLQASKNESYSVRLDALQFWPVVSLNSEWLHMLQPLLPDLLSILLDNMVYSQEDYLGMDEAILNEENASIPDRPEEMAPRFHKEDSAEEEDDDDKE